MSTAPKIIPMRCEAPPIKVWTVGRMLSILASMAVAVAAVAVKPDAVGSLVIIITEICLMGVLVKTWLLT